ncbi:Gfo/Idh/MocA family oxidoreductase [Alicyclobacillus fastidiosus]|uniref:Gfo/Idh/MocA family oxidoreductase n=1 Tax=Alicyclobacillus fastidiosus TaxID=392011 RepID=A0ABY6ZQZ3_9BACL|nr:Gfo/Idh/MocA family oxidoreductase [Alicyclobacillus fastidiosus]WAH44571.1 Gfo/Idh/MocA family oxidoreductase [Alicyclobacillus fastidiosus]
MVDAAKECGKKLHIQLSTLYSLEAKAAKLLIDEGKLGKIYHARSTGYRRRGRPYVDGYGTEYFTKRETASGGALLDMGVYHLAQLLYLLGTPEVTTVSGRIYQEIDMDEKRRTTSGFDVEELAVGFVRFRDGLTLDVIESWAIQLNGFEGSSIAGTKGGIRLPGITNSKSTPLSYHTTICDMEMDSTFDLNAADYRWHQLKDNTDAYDSSQHHWIAALQGRVELLPTAEIALQTMLISEGIYLSDHLNQEVKADDVVAMSRSCCVQL